MLARLKPFGFQAVVADPHADPAMLVKAGAEAVELDRLFEEADVITLHCPLTPETHHVVNAVRLARKRDRAALVNTARGGLVDPEALAAALASGEVRAAALDVFEAEPLPSTSPLRACPNLLLTPHAAWYSTAAIERLQSLAVEEIRRHLTGATRSTIGNGRLRQKVSTAWSIMSIKLCDKFPEGRFPLHSCRDPLP